MENFTDVTKLWKSAHPHLVPFDSHLDNGYVTKVACPACNNGAAVEVKSKIQTEGLALNLPVIYCGQCCSYHVKRGDGEGMLPWGEKIISVDTRLWSATPTFLNLEPTTRCNFDCWYCVGRHMKQADIEVSRFIEILDRFPGLRTLALVGEGEPLMHKQFFEMVKIARDRGIMVGTISNGSTFSRSNIEKLCDSGINYISVSIDSTDFEQFSSSRIGGDLTKVLNNIRSLVEYRDAIGSEYPKIGLKGTLFLESIDQMPKIVDLAKQHGVEIFEGFQALNPMCTYVPIYSPDKRAKLAEIDEVNARIRADMSYALSKLMPIYEFATKEGIEIDNNGTPNGLRPGCDEQWIYSLLSGDVTPCCQIKEPQNSKWNLAKYSIEEIELDPDYQNLRFNLWNGLFPHMCDGCWKTQTSSKVVQDIKRQEAQSRSHLRGSPLGGVVSRVVRFFR